MASRKRKGTNSKTSQVTSEVEAQASEDKAQAPSEDKVEKRKPKKSKRKEKRGKAKAVGENKKGSGKWTCPITLEPFQDPLLLGDGVTYERSAIEKWMQANRWPKVGPTGIPIVSLIYGVNEPVARMIRQAQEAHLSKEKVKPDEKEEQESPAPCCPITLEPFQYPLAIVPKESTMWRQVSFSFFEAHALMEALEATWGQYHLKLAEKYIYGTMNHQSKSLAETHVALPNRLLMSDMKVLFALPKRGPGPVFDLQQVSKYRTYGLVIPDQKNPQDMAALRSKMTQQGNLRVFQGIRAEKWILQCHLKSDRFFQCLFIDCIFAHMCLCCIEFVACRFVRCTFSHCQAKGLHMEHSINCEFEQCTIVSKEGEASNLKINLVGIHTESAKDADEARCNLLVVTFR